MAYRELTMEIIKDILRRHLHGEAKKVIARACGIDKNTIKKYIALACELGFSSASQLDEISLQVFKKVHQKNNQNETDFILNESHSILKEWVTDKGLSVTKALRKLSAQGVKVSYSGLYRYLKSHDLLLLRKTTVRMEDTLPGEYAEVDFGRLGFINDPVSGHKRVLHALVLTLKYSRHMFVYLTFSQDVDAFISGHEEAFEFFGGVPIYVVIDNLKDGFQ